MVSVSTTLDRKTSTSRGERVTREPFPVSGWIAYAGLRSLAVIVPCFSERVVEAFAAIVGAIAYLASTNARRSAARNVGAVIGHDDADLLALRVRETFRTQASNYCDLVSIPQRSPSELASRIDMVGWSNLEDARATNRGTLLVCAHLGNFDAAGQIAVHLKLPVMVLVEQIRPEALLNYVTRLRANFGLRFVPIDETSMRKAMHELRQGGVVAVAIDRDVQDSGELFPFFGKSAHLSSAVATLARRTRSLIVPFAAFRLGTGRYRLVIRPFIDPGAPKSSRSTSGNSESSPRRQIMQTITKEVEHLIRQQPGQWVMFSSLFPKAEGP